MEDMRREEHLEKSDSIAEKNQKLEATVARHKNVMAAIMAANEELLLFNAVPVGISITNAKGQLIRANKTVLELLGYTIQEMSQIDLFDIYVDAKERVALVEKLEKTGSVRGFETDLKRKDGQIVRVMIHCDTITLNGEKVLLTSIQDITKFKADQETREEAESQRYALFNNAPVGITVTDFSGGVIANNIAIYELLGYTAEEFKKLSAVDFYFDKEERQQLLDETLKNHIVRDFETSFLRKDGKPIAVLLNTDLIDFGDQHGVLLTSIRDISNIKHIEEELVKERDFTNAILDTAALLILVFDQDGKITKANKAFEKITGYTFLEIRGKVFWEALSAEPDAARERIQQLLQGIHPGINESFWVTKSGAKRLISWTITVLLDKAAAVEYVVVTGVDITERRQAEDELLAVNIKLKSWVGQLEEKAKDITLLGEMGGYLQGCNSVGEACTIGAQYISQICPLSSGAIYLINSSRDLAEAYETWGSETAAQKLFPPMNCWAVRRGKMNLIDEDHPGPVCAHITGPKNGRYLCLPMAAKGEIIGVLHLNHTNLSSAEDQLPNSPCGDHKTTVLSAAAETIALALSNIMLQETLRQQSIRDILTGLFNRRYMEESLTRELHRAEREHASVGVLMFDIDHFKDFNDVYGHDGGDAMLHELGSFLLKNTRGEDIVCRYGGEEFIAVFPNATLENASKRAEDLRLKIKELVVYHLDKPLRKCTISIGVASFPEHGHTSDEIIKAADNALYRAKNEGRDRVALATR